MHTRRINLLQQTKEELQIGETIHAIEKLGAHTKLTDCIIALTDAQRMLADWIDMQIKPKLIDTFDQLDTDIAAGNVSGTAARLRAIAITTRLFEEAERVEAEQTTIRMEV